MTGAPSPAGAARQSRPRPAEVVDWVDRTRLRPWLLLSMAAAVLAGVGNVVGLTVERIYAPETVDWQGQALAQDLVGLVVVVPAVLITAIATRRGSLRAYLLWVGFLTFMVYNYVIYAFGVQFGPLFNVWVAVLGASLFSLIGGLAAVRPSAVRDHYDRTRSLAPTAWFLVGAGALFAVLWLNEIVPALLADDPLESAAEVGLPTNPVQVLDLAFFLPAVIGIGLALRRGRPFAFVTAPGLLVFIAVTGLPILATPFVHVVRDETAEWGPFGPIAVLTVVTVVVTVRLLARVHEVALDAGPAGPRPAIARDHR